MNENKKDFSVGENVWLTKDIFDGGGDCHPAGYVGRRGDYMRITGLPDYNPKMIHVVHFDYKGEGGICVYPHEISKSTPLLTIAERREYVQKYNLQRSGLTEKDLRMIVDQECHESV